MPRWMRIHHRYRVWFKLDGQKRRSFVGVYLGSDNNGQEWFSLRPLAGTSGLPKATIEAFRDTSAPISLPEKVGDLPSLAEDETTGYAQGPKVVA